MTAAPDLFRDILQDISQNAGMGVTKDFWRITRALMIRCAEKGMTLEQLSDPKVMNRSIRTLRKHARRFDLSFPDYVPKKLRKPPSKM